MNESGAPHRPQVAQNRWFLVSLVAGCATAVLIAYDVISSPIFALALFGLNLVPTGVAWVIYRFEKRLAAWGWLLAVVLFTTVVWGLMTFGVQGSTASIGFLWLPVWNVVVVGPAGALLTVVSGRLIGRKVAHKER